MCVYAKSVCVCVLVTSNRADWSLNLNFNSLCQINTLRFLSYIQEIFSTKKDSGISPSLLSELTHQTEQAAIDTLIYPMLAPKRKLSKEGVVGERRGEGKQRGRSEREKT